MSDTQPDPLDLFRSSITLSLPPTLLSAALEPSPTLPLSAYISFPQPDSSSPINIPKDTPTRYTSKVEALSTDYYTVAQIWLAWTERDTGVRDYLIRAQAGGVGSVAVTDRRGVVEYLMGGGDGGGRLTAKGESLAPATTAASSLAEMIPSNLDSAGPSKAAVPAKRKYEVDVADREFCKRLRAEEIELQDRNSVLRCTPGGKSHNFQSFLQELMVPKIRALRKSMDSSGGKSAPQAQVTTDPSRGAKKARSNNPIIMISSAPTSLVTMWNVKKFLEQGVFEPSEDARRSEAALGNTRAEDMIPVLRKRSGPSGDITSKYYIVDGVEALQKFGQDAWDRVICVVTTGQAWQFKPYKWQDPKTLFRNVRGVYFQWNNEQSNNLIRDWNVTEMRIDKLKRHADKKIVSDFWRLLDDVKRR